MLHRDPGPLAPSAVAEDVLAWVRGLEREVDVTAELLCNLDSSDMGPEHWEMLGSTLASRMSAFDGFVVLHGTDTMAYTACALSFMLRGLPKPVVLTGAQRPIAYVRTDARINLVHSALCAAMDIPEVGIYFGRWLFRGNRATKTSIQSYDAFESPDFGPLVEMGVEVRFPVACIRPRQAFSVVGGFARDVVVVHVLPGSDTRMLDAAVANGARGIVIRGFGSGNIPQLAWPAAIRRAVDAGAFVAVVSQCLRGTVDLGAYEGGRAALDAGAAASGAMTLEATTVKMMHVLGQQWSPAAVRAAWETDIAGET